MPSRTRSSVSTELSSPYPLALIEPLQTIVSPVAPFSRSLRACWLAETRDAAKNFAALVKRRGIAPETVEMRASLNPLGHVAATGSSVRPWSELAPYFAGLVKELAAGGFRGPFAVADARVIH